jgi:hypothetical protein
MNEGPDSAVGGGGPFERLDPRLNVFALANGIDLTKGSGFRRLEWFTQGLERGILIAAEPGGSFRLEASAWQTGSNEAQGRAALGEGLSADELGGMLEGAIATANGL